MVVAHETFSMYYVYILQSLKNGKMYTGFSRNLRARLKAHKNKGVHTTKRMGQVELIFYEAFKKEADAKRREKYLKTTKGKRTLKLILKESLAAFV